MSDNYYYIPQLVERPTMKPPVSRLSRTAITALSILLGMLILVPISFAAKVFLNGVEISSTDMSNRQLNDVQRVIIDENGDVHIVAAGYDVRVQNARRNQAPRNAESMARIVGEPYIALFVNESGGSVPYTITLKINGETVETFESDRHTTAIDVSGYVKLGQNDVQITAERVGRRTGPASEAQMRLVVGPGSNDGQRAAVRRIRASLDVEADESERRVVAEQQFTIEIPEQ